MQLRVDAIRRAGVRNRIERVLVRNRPCVELRAGSGARLLGEHEREVAIIRRDRVEPTCRSSHEHRFERHRIRAGDRHAYRIGPGEVEWRALRYGEYRRAVVPSTELAAKVDVQHLRRRTRRIADAGKRFRATLPARADAHRPAVVHQRAECLGPAGDDGDLRTCGGLDLVAGHDDAVRLDPAAVVGVAVRYRKLLGLASHLRVERIRQRDVSARECAAHLLDNGPCATERRDDVVDAQAERRRQVGRQHRHRTGLQQRRGRLDVRGLIGHVEVDQERHVEDHAQLRVHPRTL